MSRSLSAFVIAAALVLPVWGNARADNEPLLWPDGTITYRDWGLYRPGVPVLIERPYRYGYGGSERLITKNEGAPYYPGNARDPYYYPTNHRDPDAYRMKPPVRPVPAEPYFRSWGVGSDWRQRRSPRRPKGLQLFTRRKRRHVAGNLALNYANGLLSAMLISQTAAFKRPTRCTAGVRIHLLVSKSFALR